MEIIKAFENNDLNMHITIQGTHEEPLFRASDIGAILEINMIRSSIRDFDDTEKVVHKAHTPGGEQEVLFLTEKGLYQVLFTSRKPIAKKFKDWVCEVIKEIRLKGKYEIGKQLEQNLLTNFGKKSVVYVGFTEELIIKGGWSDDIERRLTEHKRDIRPDFTFEYIFESLYAREIERQMLKHSMIVKKRISKVYNGKNQTELFQLDSKFTIKDFAKIVKEIKEQVEKEESNKDKDSEINQLKLELVEKNKLIEELKKQPTYTNSSDNYVYIEINITGKDLYRISSSIEEIKEPRMKFSYKTSNASKIIDIAKVFLKNYNKKIDDWISIIYQNIKQVVDFCIMIYDMYKIDTDIEKLGFFISRYNSNRISSANKARITIEKNIYEKFIEESLIIDPDEKATCNMLCDEFYSWYKKTIDFNTECDLSHIRSLQGNYNTSFREEFMKTIAEITNIEYCESNISVINKKRGLNYSNCAGFLGIGIKNPELTIYYEESIYKRYIDEFITISNDERDKISRKEILKHFTVWTEEHSIYNPNSKKKLFVPTFIEEIINSIEKLSGLTFHPKKTKRTDSGIFIGMTHKDIECKMNKTT